MGDQPAPSHGGRGAVLPAGKRGGAPGLRPQHLLDCQNSGDSAAKAGLLEALLNLVTATSTGRMHTHSAPYLCAVRLIPLRKMDGGVRLIAVGDTLRRLVPKRNAAAALAPLQTAFAKGSPCEVAAMGGVQRQADTLHIKTIPQKTKCFVPHSPPPNDPTLYFVLIIQKTGSRWSCQRPVEGIEGEKRGRSPEFGVWFVNKVALLLSSLNEWGNQWNKNIL